MQAEFAPNPVAPSVAVEQGNLALIPLNNSSDLPPVADEQGKLHDVVAWLEMPSKTYKPMSDDALGFTPIGGWKKEKPPTRVAICRNPDPKEKTFTLLEFQDGVQQATHTVSAKPERHAQHLYPNTTGFRYNLAVVRKAEGVEGPALAVTFHTATGSSYDNPPHVEAGNTPVTVRHGYAHQVIKTGNRLTRVGERLRSATKIALGAVAVYAALASGGLLDHAGEAFHKAGPSVEQRLDNYKERSLWMKLSERVRGQNEQQYQETVGRVARTMEDLDAHNNNAIKERAEIFKQKYANELMTADQINAYHNKLTEAKTPEEALSVLDQFMKFYGKTARFLDKDIKSPDGELGFAKFDKTANSTADVRWLAGEFIATFSYLPKSLVENGKFEAVEIAGAASTYALGGVYRKSGERGVLTFPIKGTAGHIADMGVNAIPDVFVDTQFMSNKILHEFGHSLDVTGPSYSLEDAGPGQLKQALGELIQMPGEQSLYAASDDPDGELERRAENFASALDIRSPKGLSHPDQWRNFISGANTSRLRIIAAMEATYPGFTDYIASLRLNDYSAFRMPIIPFVQVG